MATMQGYISGQESQLDDLPSWKRDLILRKRANVRMHGGFGLPTPTPSMAGRGRGLLSGPPVSSSVSGPSSSLSGPACSLRGPHLPLIRSVSGPASSHPYPSNNNAVSSRLEGGRVTLSGGSGDGSYSQKCAVKSEIASANVSNMHHKGLNDEGPRVTSPTYSSYSDSCTNVQENDEDFSYGPGIVSKLKNRYMSLAMRDSRSRPPLRKFSSLEDLLDDPRETWQERSSSVAKPRHGHNAQANAASHRREVMKRARSVDSLSSRLSEETRSRGLPKSKSATSRLQSSLSALQKDDVIIIETSKPKTDQQQQQLNGAHTKGVDGGEPPPLTRKMSSSNLLEEDEMPPPDTVRHVKKMFEPVGGKALRGTKARVAAHKAAQAAIKTNGVSPPTSKPALMAKPTDIPPRKVTPSSGPAFPVTIEEAKSSLKQVAQVSRASPRATLSVRATALNGDAGGGEESAAGGGGGRARPGLTPVTASVTAPLVNGDELRHSVESNAAIVEEGVRRVSNAAVNNIRKESQCQEFNFTRSSSSTQSLHPKAPTKPSSPTPTPLPASPVVSHRVPLTSSSPAATEPPHQLTSSPETKITKSQESDRVQQENLKNAEKSRGGGPESVPSRFDPHKVTKVESIRSPTKSEQPPPFFHLGPKGDPVKFPAKVESPRSTPAQGKEQVRGSQKAESPQNVVLSPVESKASSSPFLSDDLVRSPGKGNLVEAFNKTSAQGISPVLKPANRDWRGQTGNTQVFNFTDSKAAAPDYVENDGLDLSNRTPKQLSSGYVYMPGWEGPRDSSTDGDDLDDLGSDYLDARPGVIPPPSGIVFEGEAVIINGRSNLQRQPKTKKLTISFDDAAQTYEYPSEASLIEENLPFSATSTDLTGTSDTSSATHGGLASYTPSKIQIGSSFELGVSRTAPSVQASPPTPPVQTERSEEEYLRPADESETVTWSAESTSDMLF
ncbi:uncharacterized protein LOC135213705 isoform X2 [Macrobrachium nipponense]|uniref:uncharacterized protein LOC135213705 isoform X2 n=1 Tax=Macrobrachium nipponense TaxID=159736 RepID=UPI0030C85BF6